MKRVLLQPAYVLHRRAYRESSFLVELLTPQYGRLTVIAKGVRKARSAIPGLLQPFTPLIVSWMGKGELMILSDVDLSGAIKRLPNKCLFAGFYLNELMMRLLQKWDAHPSLYTLYEEVITRLQNETMESVLRSFEIKLLDELGYGLLPKGDAIDHAFMPNKYYRFMPEHGFVLCESENYAESTMGNIFSGKNLIAIAREAWHESHVLQDAKRLIRMVLAPLLGERPLNSRQLFMTID